MMTLYRHYQLKNTLECALRAVKAVMIHSFYRMVIQKAGT